MARHPFDPISLVFGLVFAAAGMIVLLDASLVDEGAFLVPTGLIALGLALLYEARRKSTPSPAPDQPTVAPTAPDPSEPAHLVSSSPTGTIGRPPSAPDADAMVEPAAVAGPGEQTTITDTGEPADVGGMADPRRVTGKEPPGAARQVATASGVVAEVWPQHAPREAGGDPGEALEDVLADADQATHRLSETGAGDEPGDEAGEKGLTDEAGDASAGEDGPGDEVGAEGGEDGEVEEPGGGHDR